MTSIRLFEWDERKAARNAETGRPSFEEALGFEFATALVSDDLRRAYGEARKVALGFVGDRLHVMVYTERDERIRIISFRKANAREIGRYERETKRYDQDGGDA